MHVAENLDKKEGKCQILVIRSGHLGRHIEELKPIKIDRSKPPRYFYVNPAEKEENTFMHHKNQDYNLLKGIV